MTLDDAKGLVRVLVEKQGNDRTFVTGVIMISPIICKSFEVDDLIKATGFTRNQIERAALNFYRYGIWTDDGGWHCEWGKMFADGEVKEDEVMEIQMSFILDAFVGEGIVAREHKKGKFYYQSLEAQRVPPALRSGSESPSRLS